MRTLERRISNLEGPPAKQAIFLYANADDFDTRLAEAKATGARVIVADDNTPPRIENGVEYMDCLNAAFTQLAAQPSKTGRGNALDDLLQSLGGNVIGPARIISSI